MPQSYAERLYDSQTDEYDASACSCNSSYSSFTSETASVSAPHEHYLSEEKHGEQKSTQRTESCAINDGNMTSHRVLPASGFRSSKLSPMSVRKVRRKLHMDAFGKSSALGIMQNGYSRNWVSSTRSSVPSDASSDVSKQQHAVRNSSHREKELVYDSDISSEQMPCPINGDLEIDNPANVPRPLKGTNVSGSGSAYDAIAVQRGGVLSSYLHTHLLACFIELIIRTLRSQWNFLFHILFSLMLAWYHSFFFALHPLSHMLRARAKATEAYRKKEVDSEKLRHNLQKKASVVMQPTVAVGARKLAFGSLSALYTLTASCSIT
ncbi:hypothetical protein GOP47_0008077 [Adiantum capillus-veneris]|uniref:Uncharacterized protein n=1 Tax=Adiantum capillus-veneris TaxID=13818 RepID=A0A9D4ZJB9_ADICA|nr:hypothetical protein GOP47_0008077 [Adiantum capillus-veneris]